MYSETFLEKSLGKAFLILMILPILSLEAWVYDLLLDFKSDVKDWFFF